MDKVDLEKLLNTSVELAKMELEKRGVFAPFGCSLKKGKFELQMAMPYRSDQSTKEALETLKEGLRNSSRDIKITALAYCVDTAVSVSQKQDVIYIQVENRKGDVVVAQLPYSKKENGEIEYEEMQFSKGNPELFVS